MFATALKPEDFARRRARLMDRMGEGTVAVLPAATETVRNRDVHHPFRQDSDFQYLTGFPEPEAVAVLAPGREAPFILFCRERDPEQETWTGRRAGPEGARARYGADEAHPLADIDSVLPGLLENRERVYYSIGYNPTFDQRVMDWVKRIRGRARAGVRAPGEFVALEHLLHEMRLFKSPAEVAVMREAGRISGEAHVRAMRVCRPGMMEYQIEAELLHVFRAYGAGWAYPAIVGGGENACILHYTENDAVLGDGDLLLIDAGAEVHGYAADITRTFPVNGRYSPEQRALYDLVLAAQEAAIAEVRPGRHWNQPHEAAVIVLTQGLVDLGLLQGDPAERVADESYRRFYMHRTGHWLGMDVHDVGDYKRGDDWRVLEPGMVMTVEPGLYVAAGTEGADERWWNTGIRIEDDVLVTAQGCEVLTTSVPRTADAIEALMAEPA